MPKQFAVSLIIYFRTEKSFKVGVGRAAFIIQETEDSAAAGGRECGMSVEGPLCVVQGLNAHAGNYC